MIHIGTSGWQYDDWKGRFYPKDLPKTRWLAYFSKQFSTVEVNNLQQRHGGRSRPERPGTGPYAARTWVRH